MKLHLPTSLRRCLLLAMVSVSLTCQHTASAAVMHSDVSVLTYTDFGQNLGRYSTGPINALLGYIREQEGGVTINYTGGQPSYTLLHGMIDFSSQCDGGYGAAIGYNWYATVQHNAVHNNTYSGNFIGSANAVHYVGIEYRTSENNTFLHTPATDYKITRQSKLLTDITGSIVYGSANRDYSDINNRNLTGQLLYRSGSGGKWSSNHDGVFTSLSGGYITGGITTIGSMSVNSTDGSFSFWSYYDYSYNGVSNSAPLPYAVRGGDSGSPVWIWNESTGQYEYLNATQGMAGTNSHASGAAEWTLQVMESYNKSVSMADGVDEVHIGAVNQAGDTLSDATNNISATQYWGSVTNAAGEQLQEFRGVQSGINTWNDLSPLLKESSPWYAYGAGYLNATSSGAGADLSYADLFNTDNLVFVAGDSQVKHVIVDADVDLGIGYVQFSKTDEVGNATFYLSSAADKEGGGDYLLNSAGYVVDAGVSVHVGLTGAQEGEGAYLREWRKIGDGDLYIEGSGDNYVLLNLGGNGSTYLQREAASEGGSAYSAYNVLANNGTTVVIKDIGQIKNDFTFGFRGGVLDMNGNSMVWNNDNKADAAGFTIHALDEHAIISNSQGHTVLTWTQDGDQKYLGSFTDSESGSLKFIYNGGEGSSLTLHSIHTDLSHHAADGKSGIEVASGTVKLVGTNTVHAMGSLTGTNSNRYSNSLDWHYADMTTHVTVDDGATFELGNHARLTGDVSIKAGGLFLMREGVQHQYEYVEGGYVLEDTYQYRDFYGLKGNIANEGTLRIEYSEGTTSTNTYTGVISGSGAVEVNLGMQGTLVLENKAGETSTYSGTKVLESGLLIANNNSALGDTSGGSGKWLIRDKGILVSREFTGSMESASIMAYIDSSSSGVLALTDNRTEAFDTSNHKDLYIGALEGYTIEYGTTDQALAANSYDDPSSKPTNSEADGYWRLGGGGGELVVNFLLTGNNDLILGNEYGKGSVTLTNAANNFSGNIYFNGAITLDYTSAGALGQSSIKLDYATRIPAITAFGNIVEGATGVLLLKEGTDANPESIDLTKQTAINIGTDEVVTYNGNITLAEGAAYHFGGGSGTLTINSDLSSGHDLIIDGQTYSGGTVILQHLQTLNDDGRTITVMGYSAESTSLNEGNATLKLLEGQTFTRGQQITLLDGGIIDLAGTSQTFDNLSTKAGSLLKDSSEGSSASITLTTTDTLTLEGDIDVSQITKTGTGTLALGGSNQYGQFTVNEGTIQLLTDTALASGEATFNAGTTLDFNGHTTGGIVWLDGTTANAASGGGVAAGGSLIATENGGTITTAAGKTFTVSGSIGAVEGSTLTLDGAGAYVFYGDSINEQGGTLALANVTSLKLGSGAQNFGGTISLKAGSTITNAGPTASYSFDTLYIDSNEGTGTVRLNTGAFGVWSTWSTSSWSINHLEGSGALVWDPSNFNWNSISSTINFAGEGHFDGTVSLYASAGSSNDWISLSRYVQLSHDNALQNAAINMVSEGRTSHQIALAINTANAQIKGINSSGTNTHIYAGAANTGNQTSFVSTRTATLTFTAEDGQSYTFTGTVGLNDASTSNGISLAMNGKGTQNFNGATVIVNDVTVLQGTLAFGENTALTIRGDIALAQGGTLTIGSGFTLNAGQTISILSQEGSTQGATFDTPTLTLNGGAFSLSADIFRNIGGDTAMISGIGSVQLGGNDSETITSLTINLSDTNLLKAGTYTLASGDWGAASDLEFNTTGLDYMNAEYKATEDGLTLTITTKDGNYIWDGTNTATIWNESTFGQTNVSPGEGNTAIFNDVAESKDVQLNASAEVAKLLFDNNADYTLTGAEGTTITTGNITQRGTGKTSINAGVTADTVLVEQGTLELQQAATISQSIDIRNSGILSLASLSGENSLTLSMGKNATLAFTGNTPGTLTLNSLALETGGTITFDNARITNNATAISRLFLSDSTLRLLNGSVLDEKEASYRLTNSEFTVEGNGTLYIKGFRLSNNSSATPSTLTVAQGATLVVTGDTLGQDGAFALSHWQTDGNSLRVAGTLTSNAAISSWDSSASITVLDGGVLNLLKGLSRNGDKSNGITLDVEKGGSLYAAGGNQNASLGLFLHAGSTLGAIGNDVTFSNDMLLGTMQEVGTVTIQTNYSSAATDGSFAVTQGGEGGTINLTGNISSYVGTSLALTGNGIVNSQGTLAVGAGLQVQDSATLCVSGALSVLGDITVADGASLSLQGATLASSLSLASGSLSIRGDITMGAATSITNGGTISLAEGTTFHLSVEDINDASYTIISGTGSITYSDAGSLAFFINGLDATSWTDIMTVTSNGNELYLTLHGAGQDLTWNGSEDTSTVWAIGNESLNWQTQGGASTSYKSLSNVTFAEGGSHIVSVSGEVVAQKMEITAGSGEAAWTFASSEAAPGSIDIWTDMSIKSGAEARFDVDVAIGGGLTVEGQASFGKDVSVDGRLTVGGQASFASTLSVGGAITVTGELALTAAAAANGSFGYRLDASQGGTLSLDTQGTALTYNAGSLKADSFLLTGGGSLNTNLDGLILNSVEIGQNTTLTLTNKTATSGRGKTLGQISLNNGATLAIYDTAQPTAFTEIGGICLKDGATATITDTYNSGYNRIASLSGSGTLNFIKKAQSTICSVYELGTGSAEGTGSFSGTIGLSSEVTGDKRAASLIISEGDIAKNAVIAFGKTTATDAGTYLGLGVHANTVTIAGLESQQATGTRSVVYSGTFGAQKVFSFDNIEDSTLRTLSITTAKDTSHTYYGQIYSNVNLHISGEGTQTFAGASSAFNGSITLESGTLVFANANAAAMLATASNVSLTGGTLDLSALGLVADSGTAALTLRDGSTFTFGSGITLNMGALGYGTYQIFDTEQANSFTGWTSLTEANLILSGNYSTKTSVSFGAGGILSIEAPELVWNGRSDSNTWVTEGTNWLAGQNSVAFESYDVVRFADGDNLSKEVSVAETGVTASIVTVGGNGFQFTGGTLDVQDTLTIEQDASATFDNVTHITNRLDVEGTAQFNNTLSVDGTVTVTGKLALTAAAATNNSFNYKLDATQGGTLSLDTQGRALTYNSGSLKADSFLLTGGGSLNTNLEGLVLNNVEIGQNTTLTITNQTGTSGAGKTLGLVTLNDGATFDIYSKEQPNVFTEIGGIALKDGATATFTDTNHSGYNRIASLSGSGTLNFTKKADSQVCSVYELGTDTAETGSFSGTIGLSSEDTGTRRSATLVISQGDIAKNAVIAFGGIKATDNATYLGLGVHADTVTIAGLESQQATGTFSVVYSGTFGARTQWTTINSFTDDSNGTPRTLSINTAADTSHTYYGQIYSNVNLNISGEGTQTFAGASSDFNGSITLESGTLAFANADAAAMLATTGGVTLTGGTLDLSALTLTADSAAIALGDNSSLTFGENIKLNLGALGEGTYTLFSGGSLDGWANLTIENLVTSGISGHGQATFNPSGSVTISGLQAYDLVWDASRESGTWESSTENWKHGENNSNFANGDSVTFDSTAAVEVVGDVQAKTVTVDAGADLTLTRQEGAELTMDTLHIKGTLNTAFGLSVGTVSSEDGSVWKLLEGAEQKLAKSQLDNVRHLHVDKGATLAVSDETLDGFALGENTRLTGDGTVALHLSTDYTNTVNTGSEFSGTTYVQAGNMTLDGSTVGSALKLADGSHAQLSRGSEAAIFEQALILEGTSEINQNGRNLTMSGEVSGEGTYKHTGGGNLTFTGNVDLGGFYVDNTVASSTTFAGDSTTVGDVTNNNVGVWNSTSITFASKETTIKGDVSLGGVTNTLNIGGALLGTSNGCSITGAIITAKNPEEGQKQLSIKAREEGKDAVIGSGSLIYLMEQTSLELENVRISSNVNIAAYISDATLTVNRVTIELPSTSGTKSTTDSSMELSLTGSGKTYTVAEGTKVYTLTSSALQDMSISGESLCFDLSNLDRSILSGYDLLCISLGSSELTGLDGLTVSATTGMSRSADLMTGYYETGLTSSPVVYFDLSGAAIPTPEPTTTTLGLLALSALAARRRRKAR